VQHYLTLRALAYPEVAFTFSKDGRLVWQLPLSIRMATRRAPLCARGERLRAVRGGEQKLLPWNFHAAFTAPAEARSLPTRYRPRSLRSSPAFGLGFIGVPGVSRSTREDPALFVNPAPVETGG